MKIWQRLNNQEKSGSAIFQFARNESWVVYGDNGVSTVKSSHTLLHIIGRLRIVEILTKKKLLFASPDSPYFITTRWMV